MAADYQRGYSKGYSAGMKRGYRFMNVLLAAAKDLRARAELAESARGFGVCQDCSLWRRERKAKWGRCKAVNAGDLETPWMLASDDSSIATSENFGCVRFKPGSGQ